MSARCDHESFEVHADVLRISEKEGGPIIGYSTDLRVRCAACGLQFRWRGLPAGLHPDAPRVSIDGTTLRAPIEPAYVTEIAGIPLVSGSAQMIVIDDPGYDPAAAKWWEDKTLPRREGPIVIIMSRLHEAMLAATTDCGCDHYVDPSAGVHPDQWQAMIDAALK